MSRLEGKISALDGRTPSKSCNSAEYQVWPRAIWPHALILAVVGFMYSCLLGVIGAGLTGAGHGWGGGAGASILPLIQVPILGVVWAYRRSSVGFYLCIALLVSAIVNDFFLLMLGLPPQSMIERAPEMFMIWAALFVSWQIAALWAWYVAFNFRLKYERQRK